ncbi:unnamed protein product, partial [Durusdinium trenchii]
MESSSPLVRSRSSRLQMTCWEVRTWWKDSTDVTLLNSPALRRPTGRHLRSLWLCMHLLLWSSICSSDLLHSRTSQSSGDQIGGRCLGEVPSYGAAALIPSISARALMFVLLLMSLWFSVKNQESLLQSMLFVVSTCLSCGLLIPATWGFTRDEAFLCSVAMLCHCNPHPVALLFGVVSGCLMLGMPDLEHGQPLVVISELYVQIFGGR